MMGDLGVPGPGRVARVASEVLEFCLELQINIGKRGVV